MNNFFKKQFHLQDECLLLRSTTSTKAIYFYLSLSDSHSSRSNRFHRKNRGRVGIFNLIYVLLLVNQESRRRQSLSLSCKRVSTSRLGTATQQLSRRIETTRQRRTPPMRQPIFTERIIKWSQQFRESLRVESCALQNYADSGKKKNNEVGSHHLVAPRNFTVLIASCVGVGELYVKMHRARLLNLKLNNVHIVLVTNRASFQFRAQVREHICDFLRLVDQQLRLQNVVVVLCAWPRGVLLQDLLVEPRPEGQQKQPLHAPAATI